MQKIFTKDFLIDKKGCYDDSRLDKCSFMGVEPITIESILDSEIPLKDKYWFVCRKLATKEQNQQIAIDVALITIDIYEKKYPDNKAPRKAIEAAQAYLAGTITIDELKTALAAADAAASAASAAVAYVDADAYAAAAVASAAAAAAVAYADAYAAAAAAYAAAAYDADAADADKKQDYKAIMLQYLKDFVKNA